MNEPQRSIIESKKSTQHIYRLQNAWDITIQTQQNIGNKSIMEDIVWFQPPFEQGDTSYIQMCVIDGHNVHPFMLEEVKKRVVEVLKQPITHEIIQNWANDLDEVWNSNIDGGVVSHFVSIVCKGELCHIYRFQIGDCNSVVFNQDTVILSSMVVHNTTNETERLRLDSLIQQNRVLGVLQCTRVIGNRELKQKIGSNILDPIVESECVPLHRERECLIAVGSDGCFQTSFKTRFIIQEIQSMMSQGIDAISSRWMEMSSQTDNSSLILVSLLKRN